MVGYVEMIGKAPLGCPLTVSHCLPVSSFFPHLLSPATRITPLCSSVLFIMDEELVILVQQHPELYDLSHNDYDNTLVKDNIWKAIGEKFHQPSDQCKIKWALLRSYFVRARARCKSITGQAAKKIKKWRLEDQMQFLVLFLQNRDTVSNVHSSGADEDDGADDEEE